MTVRYHQREGTRWPTYLCQRRGVAHAEPICQSISGRGLDEAIGRVLIETVTPLTVDMALTAVFLHSGQVCSAGARLIVEEIDSGIDELGVLLMGHQKGAYWYGSQLSIAEARKLAPYNNATSLQVCAPVLSGIIWALENPQAGIVEADEMDFERNLEICMPYLGPVVGRYSDWTPLQGRGLLFPEDLDKEDPWQFGNFRVV